ncbi:MAG: hypothetical protein NVSMB49_02240 [Ktedonobacteraceae bacterium]
MYNLQQAAVGTREQTRYLQTTGGEAVKLTRTYGTCPTCGVGFFPAFMSS